MYMDHLYAYLLKTYVNIFYVNALGFIAYHII